MPHPRNKKTIAPLRRRGKRTLPQAHLCRLHRLGHHRSCAEKAHLRLRSAARGGARTCANKHTRDGKVSCHAAGFGRARGESKRGHTGGRAAPASRPTRGPSPNSHSPSRAQRYRALRNARARKQAHGGVRVGALAAAIAAGAGDGSGDALAHGQLHLPPRPPLERPPPLSARRH